MTTRGVRRAAGRGRRRLGILAVVAAGLVLGGIALRDGNGDGDGSTLPTVPRRAGPDAYRVLYRVEVHQEPPSVTYEERVVRRPFEGRLLAGTSAVLDRGSPDTSGTLSVASDVYSLSDGNRTLVQRRVPTSAIGDQSLAAVLDDAVDAGLAERLDTVDTVLDRSCREYVVREPGAAVLRKPTEESRLTVCIDDDGLVLRERWELRGALVLERRAVELDDSPTEAALSAAFEAQGAAGAVPSGSSVRAVDGLDCFLSEPGVPAGLRLVGRYESAALDQVVGPLQSCAWVMAGRGHFLVVEAGTGRIRLDDGLRRFSAAGLGDGALYIGWTGSEARIAIDDRRWVRVTSSAPEGWLEEYAATLRLRE